MKKTNLLLTSLLALTLMVGACKKHEANEQDTDTSSVTTHESITGKIVLPASSQISTNNLTVQSPIAESSVTDGVYKINTFASVYNTTFVVNTSGNIVLMGYNSLGSSAHDITVSSTALALLMNTPLMLSLSPEGKKEIIPTLMNNVQFPILVADVQQIVNSGKGLFDTDNTILLLDMQKIIASVTGVPAGKNASGSFSKTEKTANPSEMQMHKYVEGFQFRNIMAAPIPSASTTQGPPILITQNGRDVRFYNNGNMFATVAGIYKDGKKIQSIELEGEKFFPTSVLDVINGEVTIIGGSNPNGWPLSLEGDGTFQIKIRTGLPGSGDGSEEFERAQYLNAKNLTFYMLEAFLPFIDKKKASCFENVVLALRNQINALASVQNTSAFFYTVFDAFYNDVENIGRCLGADDIIEKKYFKALGNYFKWVDRGSALIGGSINIGFYVRQWAIANPSFDACYSATDNQVVSCNDLDAEVLIGNQTWKKRNLAVSTYRNGDVIPYVEDLATWATLTTAAWCYYNNDAKNGPVYGKLYNWYAVNDPRGLAPVGWHVASESEFRTLFQFLGTPENASIKLREAGIAHWLNTDLKADNETGFTALPGGFRGYNTIFTSRFEGLGERAVWWCATSSRAEVLSTGLIPLPYFQSVDKINGYSVRCIKD